MPAGKVTMVFDAETAKAVGAFMQIENKQKDLEARAAALAAKTGDHHDKAKKGANDWASGLGPVIAGYVSVGAVIGVATSALRDMAAEREKAGQGRMEHRTGMSALAMIAGGNADQFRADLEAGAALARGAGKPENEGLKLRALQRSLGLEGESAAVSQLMLLSENPPAAVEQIEMLRRAYGAQSSFAATADKVMFAAARTGAAPEELAGLMTKPAAAARAAGVSEDEALALVTQLSTAQQPRTAAARVEALMKGLAKVGGTGTLMERVDKLAARGMSPAALDKLLGPEAANVLPFIQENRAPIGALISELQGGAAVGALGKAASIMTTVQPAAGVITLAQAREAADQAVEDKLGPPHLEWKKIRARAETYEIEHGVGAFERWMSRRLAGMMEFFGESPERFHDRTFNKFRDRDDPLFNKAYGEDLNTHSAPVSVQVVGDSTRGIRADREANR